MSPAASQATSVGRHRGYFCAGGLGPCGVATTPWRALDAERLLVGQTLTPDTALAAGRRALAGAQAGRHNGFKIELGARTVADALAIAAARSA